LHRSSLLWLGSLSFGIVLLYLIGIFVRGQYGIAVSLHNFSGHQLREISVKVEPGGKDYKVGVLADQGRAKVFVQPRTESHITLRYSDGTGSHLETVVGYVESGYCGKAEIKILPQDKVSSSESIDPVFCKRSWLEFM